MSVKEKRTLIRIGVALAAFIAVFATDKIITLSTVFGGKLGFLLPLFLYLAVYLYIGYDVLFRAARNIIHGQIFDENFLMCIATLGAFSLAIYGGATGREIEGFDEACAVLLFYQVGEFFQGFAAGKSRKSIAALMDIRPDSARVIRNGKEETVDPSDVKIGETIVVNAGEKIPLDGVITSGSTALDTKALTGESLPRDACVGDKAVSGSVNMTSRIEINVEKKFYDSAVSKILELVENAAEQKSKSENFITKFSKYYTPAVVTIALLLAIIPSLVTRDFQTWIYRALSFLVVSCPCALVISVPMSFFCGLGAASKKGILIKGSSYLEKFDKANIFVFDKTGTLTKGNFAVTKITPAENTDEILRLAAIAEKGSSHPIAKSILSRFGKEPDGGYMLTNVAGKGIIAERDGETVLAGNEKLMTDSGIEFDIQSGAGTTVYVARNGKFVGSLLVCDEIKPEPKDVISLLDAQNCKTYMLTGDNETVAASVANEIGLSGYRSSLLPQDKVSELEKLINEKSAGDALCFIGDGINDAPVLMRSDIGLAMGGVGSDAAIEASDIVLMKDDLRGIPEAKKIAKKTMRIVRQNVIFSIAVKLAILALSAFGIASMWLAVFGDVGVAVLAILNAMRCGK